MHGWKTLLIDQDQSAGFLGSMQQAPAFPSLAQSLSGIATIKSLHDQAKAAGTEIKQAEVTQLTPGANFKLSTAENEHFHAKCIILACGAAKRSNYTSGEKQFLGKNVFHDTEFGGALSKNKSAIVIGKSQHAAEEALRLTGFAQKITFIIPSSKLEVPASLIKQVEDNKKIETLFSTSVKSINGEDKLSSITILSGGNEKNLPADIVYTYVHSAVPMNSFLKNAVEINDNGAVLVQENMATSNKGIYACGDILCGKPQIPTIAAAQGIITGISVASYLKSLG
jgi:thioredoxin reductase (NADPH)